MTPFQLAILLDVRKEPLPTNYHPSLNLSQYATHRRMAKQSSRMLLEKVESEDEVTVPFLWQASDHDGTSYFSENLTHLD